MNTSSMTIDAAEAYRRGVQDSAALIRAFDVPMRLTVLSKGQTTVRDLREELAAKVEGLGNG